LPSVGSVVAVNGAVDGKPTDLPIDFFAFHFFVTTFAVTHDRIKRQFIPRTKPVLCGTFLFQCLGQHLFDLLR